MKDVKYGYSKPARDDATGRWSVTVTGKARGVASVTRTCEAATPVAAENAARDAVDATLTRYLDNLNARRNQKGKP